MEASFATIETRFDEIIANFPVRPVAWLLRFFIQPFGPRRRGPSDRVTDACAEIITNPGPARDRLTVDLFHPTETDGEHANGVALLERAFAMTVAVQPIRDRMHAARVRDIDQAVKQRTITADEAAQLKAAAEAVAAAIAVDDFAPEELTSRGASNKGDVSSQATSQPRSADSATASSRRRDGGGVERRPVYIVDGSRTPFIKARGKPGPFTPVDLAVQCGRPLLLRQPFAPDAFDQVILGCVNVIADEMNPARVAALRLGMGEAMTAFTVQINCGSGMQSIDTAYRYIQDGIVGSDPGGRRGIAQPRAAGVQPQAVDWYARLFAARGIGAKLAALLGFRPSLFTPVIGLERGLTDPITDLNMGQTAELVVASVPHHAAAGRRIRRREPAAARARRRRTASFAGEVEPAFARDGTLFDHDDGVRPDSTADSLAKLKPAFERPWGKVTPGNSSQITDGASWVILASEDAVKEHNLTPKAVIVDSEWSALDPSVMGLGPVYCSTALLKRHELEPGRHRAVGAQRGVRRAGAGLPRGLGGCRILPRRARPRRRRPDGSRATGSMSTAAPSASAIRSAPAATASCCISSTP